MSGESRWYRDLGTRAELVYQARTVLMAAGLTPAEIDTVLVDGDVDLTAARALGGLLRSTLSSPREAA